MRSPHLANTSTSSRSPRVLKLWLATNFLPKIQDESDGMWRRLRVVPFQRQFKGAEIDPGLGAKLRQELPGILAWAVTGAVEWYRDGLEQPDVVMAATGDYRLASDALGEFIEEVCIVGDSASVAAGELFRAYGAWANTHGLSERDRLSRVPFGKKMKARFEWKRPSGVVYHGVGLA